MIHIQVEDTRDLPPPEPLERAVAVLNNLKAGSALCMRHRKEPCLLYPILEAQSFEHRTFQRSENLFEIFVWKAGDNETKNYLEKANFQVV